MKRRSFLSMLGIAPLIAKALPIDEKAEKLVDAAVNEKLDQAEVHRKLVKFVPDHMMFTAAAFVETDMELKHD